MLSFIFIEDILDRLVTGAVDSEVVAKWIIHLVYAVHHLHSNDFCHRNIRYITVHVTADDHVLLGGLDDIIDAEDP